MLDLKEKVSWKNRKGGKEHNFALLVHGTQKKGKKSKLKARNEKQQNRNRHDWKE